MEGIDGLNAAIAFELDFFFLESILNGALGVFELFVGLFEAFFGEILEKFKTARVEVAETGFLDFNTDAIPVSRIGGSDYFYAVSRSRLCIRSAATVR